ncbi:hypothetical protein BDW66DRAFT_155314 [Aspergillus desertorum]
MATADNHYGFIVIGGGTAGNTVAGRCASNPSVRILVIEAGAGNPYNVSEITTPSLAMDLRGKYGGADRTWEKVLLYLRKSATYHDGLGIYPAELQKIGSSDGPIHISHAELLDDAALSRCDRDRVEEYGGEGRGESLRWGDAGSYGLR